MKISSIFLSLSVFILLIGCSQEAKKSAEKGFMKKARGEADEMIIVVDTALWNSTVGDELKKTFNSFILGLPQDEPKFNVHQVNPVALNSTLKAAKNIVFVGTLDNRSVQNREVLSYFSDNSLKLIQKDSSLFMTTRKDEFALGQVVLYLYGQDEQQLADHIKKNRSHISEIYESAVRERTRASLFAKEEKQTMKAITEDHGYSIKIPYGWDLAKNMPDFTWIRKLEAQSEWNVFIHEAPYKDQAIFNDVASYRDKITETYLRDGEKPDIYITRQTIIPVFTERVNFNGNFAVEARGLWKISDNSGGGPFVSYTLVDEPNQMVYYIEGYVYSPGTKKKKPIREVEAILSTFRTPTQLSANSTTN